MEWEMGIPSMNYRTFCALLASLLLASPSTARAQSEPEAAPPLGSRSSSEAPPEPDAPPESAVPATSNIPQESENPSTAAGARAATIPSESPIKEPRSADASVGAASAEPRHGASSAEVDEANNPLALLVSTNIHAYVVPTLKGLPDTSATNSFLRLSVPIWRVLTRVSLPLSNISSPGSSVTGVGDLQAFAIFILTKQKSPLELGVGPLYVAPTASDPALGTGKHQGGASAIAVYKNPGLLVGTLLQYQLSFAGEARPDTEILTAQLFVIAQIGGGFYLRSTPMATFDVQNGVYNLPVGIGGGKVLKAGKAVLNFFLEPQYVLLADGIGQPAFQVFSGINMQFPL